MSNSTSSTNRHLTYLGSLDDRVNAYPGFIDTSLNYGGLAPPSNDRQFVDATFISAAIVGGPVAVNDGYLIQTPGLIEAVKRQDSVLHVLASAGYINILRRNKSLDELFDWAIENNVTSMAEMYPDDESRKSIIKGLKKLEADSDFNNGIRQWPAWDISKGFVATLRHVCEETNVEAFFDQHHVDGAHRAIEKFFNLIDSDRNQSPPRTEWERIANQTAREMSQQPLATSLMHLANAVYHVNFANCLRLDGEDVRVESCFSEVFRDIVQMPRSRASHPAPVDPPQIAPIKVPRGVPLASEAFLREIVTPDSELAIAKARYLDAVDRHLDGHAEASEVRSAARRYSSQIRRAIIPSAMPAVTDITVAGGAAAFSTFPIFPNPASVEEAAILFFISAIGGIVVRKAKYAIMPKDEFNPNLNITRHRRVAMALPLGGPALDAISAQIPSFEPPPATS